MWKYGIGAKTKFKSITDIFPLNAAMFSGFPPILKSNVGTVVISFID